MDYNIYLREKFIIIIQKKIYSKLKFKTVKNTYALKKKIISNYQNERNSFQLLKYYNSFFQLKINGSSGKLA